MEFWKTLIAPLLVAIVTGFVFFEAGRLTAPAITQPLFFKRAFAVRTVVKPGRGRSRRRGSRP